MHYKLKIVLLLNLYFNTVFCANVISLNHKYCYAKNGNPYTNFGSATPYKLDIEDLKPDTDCEPIQIWLIARHGTRYPEENISGNMKYAMRIQDFMIRNFDNKRPGSNGTLCSEDLEALRYWTWDKATKENEGQLTAQGWHDIKELARRLRGRFSKLLNVKNFTEEDYYFRHTLVNRTKASCSAFVEGLFEGMDPSIVKIENATEEDKVILNPLLCTKWLTLFTTDFISSMNENYRKSIPCQKMVSDVAKRLGFNSNLKYEDLQVMYDNCRYDKARNIYGLSPWCSVFTEFEMILLEYGLDLIFYTVSSYGREEINSGLGCHPWQHLRETFEKTVNQGYAKPKLVAMFSHDIVIDTMLTAINHSKDHIPLSATDFEQHLFARKYRTSFNTPFSTNIAAVLYKCNNETKFDDLFKVQLYFNEDFLNMDGCQKGFCKWDQFQKLFAFTNNCNFDFCLNED